MSNQGNYEEEESLKRYGQPYTSKHPVPTVQKYRNEVQERRRQPEEQDDEGDDKVRRAYDSAKAILTGEDRGGGDKDPYPSANRNIPSTQQNEEDGSAQFEQNGTSSGTQNADKQEEAGEDAPKEHDKQNEKPKEDEKRNEKPGQSATEAVAAEVDPRKKRKTMAKQKRGDGGREVTDPVTHLPVTIYDSTAKDLRRTRENYPASGTTSRTLTGLSAASKDMKQLDDEQEELQRVHDGTQQLFPPPSYDEARAELTRIHQQGFTAGLGLIALSAVLAVAAAQLLGSSESSWRSPVFLATVLAAGASVAAVSLVRSWMSKKVQDLWDDEIWDASRQREQKSHEADAVVPESVAWMNSLLSSVWPLINPDLFTSLADMLEDVMQASIPGVVRMVSIDDLGQGSEAIRILGIRWLPTGAASQSVDEDGNLQDAQQSQSQSDRTVPGQGEQQEQQDNKGGNNEQDNQDIQEGLEAEQGDFVNMELAFAYRARTSGKSLKAKAKNAHLFIKFYLPGGIAVPVWVETKGAVGKMRLRLQLTPDPPFFSLCTITFMGQPKVDVSCLPISKHALNIMDVPLISSFVQSSIDAALAEYVAPKSLTLDLKDMLIGDDFKKDTISKGVVIVLIKRARDYKEGDAGIGPKEGSSDTYATVSWGKFGKPAASTRVIVADQQPEWQEWSNILVSPEELNAEEKLRVQIWDSDKFTADDDLGRVEVDLHKLMHDKESRNKMQDREDRFMGEGSDEKMPGTLTWSVGYFAKTKITQDQLDRQEVEPDLKSVEDVEKRAAESSERKLREAKEHQTEVAQQKAQDFKELQDNLLTASPPPEGYPSGIFSIQIHNITGLEVQELQKRDKDDGGDQEDQAENADDLPSSYATIIINHEKVYRTRTKPKNAKPFFNAGTERFIRDWRTAEVMVSVRDDRERENDALLGMVYLPLRKVFQKRSQVIESWPLAGGMGYGRVRISMVWRSVELQWPKELLGWNYGTLEVKSPVKGSGQLENSKMRLRTNISQAKMHNHGEQWDAKHGKNSVFLAVKKRYSSAIVLEIGKGMIGSDPPAFAVLWLKDIPDEEETAVRLPVYKSGKGSYKRATTSCNFEGDKMGDLEVTLKFWRGLSGYHKSYANKGRNIDMRNVMEVLDTAADDRDNGEGDDESDQDSSDTGSTKDRLKPRTNQDSSDEDESKVEKLNPLDKVGKLIGSNDEDDGSRGVFSQIRDYKDHHRQLHRKHRGIMQWKGARTLDWAIDKVKHGSSRGKDVFEHSEKSNQIETEV